VSKKKHPEHVNHERWLVSYADFITLLFAFFVVLFASSQADRQKQLKMAAAMQTAFDRNGIFEPTSPRPPIADTAAPSDASPVAIQLLLSVAPDPELLEQRLRKMLAEQIAAKHIPAGSVTMRNTPEGLVISLHEAGFFASGSAAISTPSIPMFSALAAILPHGPLRVEGHTDNLPIHNTQFATNWELSTARAATITRLLLEKSSVNPADLAAAGYAEFHPIASNATESGRAQNRRVDIIILHSYPTGIHDLTHNDIDPRPQILNQEKR
jgi:chemotaxis protein MotB